MYNIIVQYWLLKKYKIIKTIDNTEHKPIALKWYIKNYKKN